VGTTSIVLEEEDIPADRGEKRNTTPLIINERWFLNQDSDNIVLACLVVPVVEYKLFNKNIYNENNIDTLIMLDPILSCPTRLDDNLTSGDLLVIQIIASRSQEHPHSPHHSPLPILPPPPPNPPDPLSPT